MFTIMHINLDLPWVSSTYQAADIPEPPISLALGGRDCSLIEVIE